MAIPTQIGQYARQRGAYWVKTDATTGVKTGPYTTDDGVTFTTPRAMPMTNQINMNMTNLGSWRGTRIWKFEHNANTPWRGKLFEIDYTVAG